LKEAREVAVVTLVGSLFQAQVYAWTSELCHLSIIWNTVCSRCCCWTDDELTKTPSDLQVQEHHNDETRITPLLIISDK